MVRRFPLPATRLRRADPLRQIQAQGGRVRLGRGLVWGLALACSGCIMNVRPKDDHGFVASPRLASFAGCYQNQSMDGGTELSRAFQPDVTHGGVTKLLRLDVPDETTVHLAGVAERGGPWQATLKAGADFVWQDGRLALPAENHLAFDVLIGYARAADTLGLDEHGNVRMESGVTMVGAVFVVIPMLGHGAVVDRFARADGMCGGASGADEPPRDVDRGGDMDQRSANDGLDQPSA